MATRVAQAFGSWDGPSPSLFRVVAEIWDHGDYGGGRKLTLRRYVQVNSGGGFGGTSLSTSWSGNIALYGAGDYAVNDSGIHQKGYGQTLSFPTSTTNANYYGGRRYESNVSISYTVPKPKYTVSYNANGGSDAPGNQTKIWGTALTLSSAQPVRNGYIFQGWATSSTGGVVYGKGASYTANASVTLYAVWKIITYTISYNANGGTNAPAAQQKNWGTNITITTAKPTRVNYNFIGWGTSSGDKSPSYKPGEIYTTNASITLYAIWELAYIAPRILNLVVGRCDSAGVLKDDGTYAKISFNWATDKTASKIEVRAVPKTGNSQPQGFDEVISGTSGTLTKIFGNNGFLIDMEYNVSIRVIDAMGESYRYASLPPFAYIIDVLSTGDGISFGKPANMKNTMDVDYNVLLRKKTDIVVEGGNYINARNIATLRNNEPTVNDTLYYPILSTKTKNGSWSIGTLGEELHMRYSSDTDYNGGTNKDMGIRITERTSMYSTRDGSFLTDVDMERHNKNKILWQGAWYMQVGQDIPVDFNSLKHGLILVWSPYDTKTGNAHDYMYTFHFVPKIFPSLHPNTTVGFAHAMDTSAFCKYLRFTPTAIIGHDYNSRGTMKQGSDVNITNSYFVLRYVISV